MKIGATIGLALITQACPERFFPEVSVFSPFHQKDNNQQLDNENCKERWKVFNPCQLRLWHEKNRGQCGNSLTEKQQSNFSGSDFN